MQKKYQIIISSTDSYPFNQIHADFTEFETQVIIQLPIEHKNWAMYQKKIRKILDLEKTCNQLVKLNSISENRKNNCYNFVYQYVEHSLDQYSHLKLQFSHVEQKICKLCQFLLQQKILPIYNINNFGFNSNKELKYLLLPSFVTISDHNQLQNQTRNLYINVKNMLKSYKSSSLISLRQTIDDDKTSQRKSQRDLSAYNKKFQQKISSIENRLLLNKHGLIDKMNLQKIKKRKKFSQNFTDQSLSASSSSENSYKITQNHQSNEKKLKQKKNSLNDEFSNSYSKTQTQKFYNKSYQHPRSKDNSSNQEKQSPQSPIKQNQQKLTNSLIIAQKNKQTQKIKHHKSSFGDYSNYGNESQKQTRLKRRITYALEKSQNALKIYEKYQSKRNYLTINVKKA